MTNNRFFKVTKKFDIFLRVGYSESNTWIGASRMLGSVYRKVSLRRGDEVQDLIGGLFVIRKSGEIFEAKMSIDERHPFEKRYGAAPEQALPTDKLIEISREQATKPATYQPKVPKMAAGRMIGGSLHSVIA
jgi:hypothetical protein